MRFVLVGPMYPYRGGIAHSTDTMFGGLTARGHEVSGVTFIRQYPRLLFPGKTQYETERAGRTAVAARIIDSINPATWFRAAYRIAAMKPDAVIFRYWMPFFAPVLGTIARLLRYRGVRCLTVVDNALPHERRIGDVWLGRYFLRACDGLVALSASVAAELKRMGVHAPVRTVNHPVYDLFGDSIPREEARARLGLDPAGPVLLFFGFVRRYKGLQVLLEAMPRIVQALPDVRLVVAGEFYEDEGPIREFVEEQGLEDHVLFHNAYIPTSEVPYYFSAADLVVQPYLSATQSGVAQIAYNFDRPLVVTDVGGLAEVVPHERVGFVVPPRDPGALAGAVIRFFSESLGPQFSEAIRQEKARFGWTPLYEALEQLAESMGSAKPALR